MVEIGFYLVTEAIARRAGVIDSRYRTQDGRFVLDDKDLSFIRLTPDEYLTGLQGIEKVTKQEALSEIQMENYQMGAQEVQQPVAGEQPAEASSEPAESVENTEVEQQPTEEEQTQENEENEATEEAEQAEVVENEEENVEQTNEEEE